jgi:hypothetical protein
MNCFNGQHNFSAFTTKSGRFEMLKNQRCPIKTVKIGKFNFHQNKPFINI